MAKTLVSFGHSECNRVKQVGMMQWSCRFSVHISVYLSINCQHLWHFSVIFFKRKATVVTSLLFTLVGDETLP